MHDQKKEYEAENAQYIHDEINDVMHDIEIVACGDRHVNECRYDKNDRQLKDSVNGLVHHIIFSVKISIFFLLQNDFYAEAIIFPMNAKKTAMIFIAVFL